MLIHMLCCLLICIVLLHVAIACAVLCCAVLCCAVLCCAVLCCAVLCCAVLGWAGLGWAGLGWAGLGWAGLGWAGVCIVLPTFFSMIECAGQLQKAWPMQPSTMTQDLMSCHKQALLGMTHRLLVHVSPKLKLQKNNFTAYHLRHCAHAKGVSSPACVMY